MRPTNPIQIILDYIRYVVDGWVILMSWHGVLFPRKLDSRKTATKETASKDRIVIYMNIKQLLHLYQIIKRGEMKHKK